MYVRINWSSLIWNGGHAAINHCFFKRVRARASAHSRGGSEFYTVTHRAHTFRVGRVRKREGGREREEERDETHRSLRSTTTLKMLIPIWGFNTVQPTRASKFPLMMIPDEHTIYTPWLRHGKCTSSRLLKYCLSKSTSINQKWQED